MSKQKRWICHTCGREWAYDPSTLTIGMKWDQDKCWHPSCGSTDIEHVTYSPPFPGGDYNPMDIQAPPIDAPPPPVLLSTEQLSFAENRTLQLVSQPVIVNCDRDEELALSSPEFE